MRILFKVVFLFACFLIAISLSVFIDAFENPIVKNADQTAVEKPNLQPANRYAEILIQDQATGKGVPLVELETVNGLQFVTDSAGRVAFHEPDLMDREVFFYVRSHGYKVPKDGFGYEGVRITPSIGKIAQIKMTRENIAERLCRLTGEGIYRDSMLLGHQLPTFAARNPGRICGQDSVRAVPYNKKIYWVWGDTLQIKYPLGLFRSAGATSEIPDPYSAKSDFAAGIDLNYFVDDTGFARPMIPMADRPAGVVWILSMFTAEDDHQKKKLIAHYSLRKSLFEEIEQGIAIFNDEKQIFEPVKQIPLDETWRRPSGHPIEYEQEGKRWFLFGNTGHNVRVPATLKAVLDPTQYEAFTCIAEESIQPLSVKTDQADKLTTGVTLGVVTGKPSFDANGKPHWRWQKKIPPTDSHTEIEWIKKKFLQPSDARFAPADSANLSDRIEIHTCTVRWNPFRKRWIMIACEVNGNRSNLGEVWYAESKEPTGPFNKAVRVVTHNKYSLYNVCHHTFLDRDEGRTIHFEGTYTNMFSGNENRTPRYEYNQMLYRLDLDSEKLKAARVE